MCWRQRWNEHDDIHKESSSYESDSDDFRRIIAIIRGVRKMMELNGTCSERYQGLRCPDLDDSPSVVNVTDI